MHLSALYIYPVKSLRGCAVVSAAVDDLGLSGDRRFMLVDETGRFLSQRTLPRMATIGTALQDDTLVLSSDGVADIRVPCQARPNTAARTVSVWKSEGLLAEDCGDDAASWLGRILERPCRLVRIGEKFLRPILKPAAGPGDRVHFADAVPFLAISEASLRDLNDRLVARREEPVPMARFRPNLVLAGCDPYAEDAWPRFRIGQIAFRSAGPCGRCVVTNTDQETGERGAEPFHLLGTYRRDAADPNHVRFGQNLIHETKRGMLRVGDEVELM